MASRIIINTVKHGLLWGVVGVCIAFFAVSATAAGGHGDKAAGSHGDKAMDHHGMTGQFKHDMTVEGVTAEFQIMSLESMKMKDPGGATHHVMVKFVKADSGEQLKEATGKIKVIAPSKKEVVVDLTDYSGTFASNVTFDEPGKYGVICLVKIDGKKPLYKFWYTHH